MIPFLEEFLPCILGPLYLLILLAIVRSSIKEVPLDLFTSGFAAVLTATPIVTGPPSKLDVGILVLNIHVAVIVTDAFVLGLIVICRDRCKSLLSSHATQRIDKDPPRTRNGVRRRRMQSIYLKTYYASGVLFGTLSFLWVVSLLLMIN